MRQTWSKIVGPTPARCGSAKQLRPPDCACRGPHACLPNAAARSADEEKHDAIRAEYDRFDGVGIQGRAIAAPSGGWGPYACLPQVGTTADDGRAIKIPGRVITTGSIPSGSCYGAPMICALVPEARILWRRGLPLALAIGTLAAGERALDGGGLTVIRGRSIGLSSSPLAVTPFCQTRPKICVRNPTLA